MYLIYSMLLGLGLLLTSPYWLVQMLRHGKYRAGFSERTGVIPAARLKLRDEPRIWIHAVSVGEVLAVSGLVERLRAELPGTRVMISTTTTTGHALAKSRFGEENVFYFPLDFAFCIRPWMAAIRPEVVVMAETEFWPNFLRLARASGARIVVANARISDRSFPRYRQWSGLLKPVLANVDRFLAQSDEDARRLRLIGASAERVEVSGNLKFEVTPPAEPDFVRTLKQVIREQEVGPVIIAGSTVETEEPVLLDAFTAVLAEFPKALLVLAPRHKERFASVALLPGAKGLKTYLRSTWPDAAIPAVLAGSALVLDTIGELASMYSLADVAFVGGSIAPKGGHNVLEAAQFGAAIVVGPNTENFRDIVSAFKDASAIRVADAISLSRVMLQMLRDPAERDSMGRRAAEVVRSGAGATERTIAAIRNAMDRAV